MPCYHPWRTDKGNVVTCGQCRGCRAAHAREWAMRCMHEASMHEQNCFVTLTYDDEHLPPGGSLDRAAFPAFMKRLKRAVGKVRYYHVGEYGTDSNRPHYHALLFGWFPSDSEVLSVREGVSLYKSELLRETWYNGLSSVGSITPQSAAYVCGYVKRRMTGSWAKAKYGEREPEYGTMSRNPGIGAGWIDKYRCDVYPADGVVVRGRVVRPPRYYDLRVGRSSDLLMDGVRMGRHNRRVLVTPERLEVMEKCAIAQDEFYAKGGRL